MPEDGGATLFPVLETALDLVRVIDALLRDCSRLEENADLGKTRRQREDVLVVFDVVLGEVTVEQVDAPFEVHVVGGEVL